MSLPSRLSWSNHCAASDCKDLREAVSVQVHVSQSTPLSMTTVLPADAGSVFEPGVTVRLRLVLAVCSCVYPRITGRGLTRPDAVCQAVSSGTHNRSSPTADRRSLKGRRRPASGPKNAL